LLLLLREAPPAPADRGYLNRSGRRLAALKGYVTSTQERTESAWGSAPAIEFKGAQRFTTTRKPTKSQSLNSIELSEHHILNASSSAFASKLYH
jgi:hypothetical protein